MSDTIFYTLKLKRTKTPEELFEKFQKYVKPRGVTKKWVCEVRENGKRFLLNFNDEGGSETFSVEFDEKRVCSGFCKVFFPLEDEQFDDKKSEFNALLNMLYSARSFFSKMEVTDDYGLCESFFESKKYKVRLRELTEEETARAERIYRNGHTDGKNFVAALLCDLRGIAYAGDYRECINIKDPMSDTWVDAACGIENLDERSAFAMFCTSFLYETTAFRDKGLLREDSDYTPCDLTGELFSTIAYMCGMGWIAGTNHYYKPSDPQDAQALKLYMHFFRPLYDAETDGFKKCLLQYRYFVSLYEWLGFRYVGPMTDETSEETLK